MLNLGNSNASFDPYIKYNGKAGRFYMKNEAGEEIEVTPKTFIMDLENIKTGWFFFNAGMAPSKVFDRDLATQAPRPDENHKRGFQVRLFSKDFNGVVELSGSSMHLNASIGDLYNAYAAEKDANVGSVPVIEYKGTQTMKDKMGTNYKPLFALVKWVARPDALKSDAAPVAQTAPVAKPQPVQSAAPATNFVSEF